MVQERFLLAASIILSYAAAQNGAPECPTPWVSRGTECYLFSKDRLSWLDAKIFCEKRQARLISVNSNDEHNFVQNWFLSNDYSPDSRNVWYTSGYTVAGTPRNNPTFMWLDGKPFGSEIQWTKPTSPATDTGDYVIYQYIDVGEHQAQPGYFWVRDSGSIPRAFICEISKNDAEKINSKGRDFEFGAANIHPDELSRGPYFVSEPQVISFQIRIDPQKCKRNCPIVWFNCEASGYPQPKYTWYEDTATGYEKITTVGQGNNHLTITNGRLTIHNPSRDRDTSNYWCEAKNDFGKIRSGKGRINFIKLEDFATNSKTTRAKAFSSAVIDCEHDKHEGVRYNYKWYLNHDPTNWLSRERNSQMFMSKSGSLYFSSVTDSDANSYHCSVSVEGGDESKDSPAYNLIVDSSPSFVEFGPIIQNGFIKVFPKNPARGDLVYLECFARFTRHGGETPDYVWTRENNLPLPEGSELDDADRRLIIHNAKTEDGGDYTCTVSFEKSGSDFTTLFLGISAKPYFGQGRLDNQHLDKGAPKFIWNCLAAGNPAPTYSWLKNGELLDPKNLPAGIAGSFAFSADMKTMELINLDKNIHSGMYQCGATNTYGTTYSSAEVRVLSFGPSFVKHPMFGRLLATESGNITMACDPEAAPAATISWLKDNKPYAASQDSSSPKRILPNNYLFLSGIQKNVDEGIYTCVAENNVPNEDGVAPSVAKADIELIVVQRSVLAIRPLDQKVLLGTRVVLECRADFNPILDLVYLWYHNNRLIDFDDWKMAQIYSRGVNVNRGDLHINNITYEERGLYKCTVMTKSDSATMPAVIEVYGPPGESAGVKASNAGKHSVTVLWVRGAQNGAAVTSYNIEKFNEFTQEWVTAANVTNPADVASGNTTVGDLFANTGYSFRVMAVNEYGIGVPSKSSSEIKTTPDLPTAYPDNIRGGGGKEGTLVIEWTPLAREKFNAPNVEYIVQYREYDGGSADTGSWSTCNDNPIPHGDKKTGKCVVTLGRDKYFLPYSIRVWVRNEMGDGPIPEPVMGMSAVKVPTITPTTIDAQAYNSTALIVNWDPIPDDRNSTGGELLGVHIQYWKSETPPELGRRNTIKGSNVTEGLIIGLEANTDYMVTAQLFNSAGDGTQGRTVKQTTWLEAPLNMPEYVTLNRTSDGTVGVHFRGVVTGLEEEPLDGYMVRIWRQAESIRNAKDFDCGRRTWIKIDEGNFQKNSFYNLRVFGYSRGGGGKMSSPLTQFVIGCNRKQTADESDAQWVYLCSACNRITTSYTAFALILLSHIIKQFL